MKVKIQLSIAASLLLISVLLTACCVQYVPDVYTSPDDYLMATAKCLGDFDSQILPLSIRGRDVKKFFAKADGIICQMGFEISYTKDDFDFEVERLKRVEEVRKIKYDTDNFNYPAYVGIMGLNNTFEYALIDEDNLSVHYLHFRNITKIDDLRISEEYLPKTYTEQLENFDGKFKDYNYSIYYKGSEEQYGY